MERSEMRVSIDAKTRISLRSIRATVFYSAQFIVRRKIFCALRQQVFLLFDQSGIDEKPRSDGNAT
jgi:hypothetical protein